MSVKIMYFVHGTTTDNEAKRSSGWNDVELSELGIAQGKELPSKILEKWGDVKFDVIISSDLKRAVDSAQLAWGEASLPILHDARIRECNYGDYNGELSEIVEPMQEKMIEERFSNGESYEDVKVRIQDFLNYLKENFDGKTVALVAHKAPQLVLDHILKGWTWEECFERDWRKSKAWQPGWEYDLN